MRRLAIHLFWGVLLVGGAGCEPAMRRPVDSLSILAPQETVLVGKVELIPPLAEDEQALKTIGSGRFKNKVFMLADRQWREIYGRPTWSDFSGAIEADLGRMFFVQSTSEPFVILGGAIAVSSDAAGVGWAYLPGGLQVTLKADDRAVYLGTLRYHRDEFFEITKVEIVDDFAKARAAFAKKFGKAPKLRKGIVTLLEP